MTDERCRQDPRHECFGLEAAARLEERVKALEGWRDESKKFHEDFYKDQQDRAERDGKIDEKLENMDKNIEKLLKTQESCVLKPGKRWDAIVDKSIWAVFAAVIAFILARIGL